MDAPTRDTPAASQTPDAPSPDASAPSTTTATSSELGEHAARLTDTGEVGASEADALELDARRPSPTPADLEATLGHLERLCGRLEQAESRFKQLTDECEGVLKGLVAVDRRHATTIASLNDRLGDWCHLESKLLEESARRIEQFERGVGHEWMVLRQLHEEPLVQLKDDADQLRMACLEAARTARHRFDSVERAYTAYAGELDRRLEAFSRDLLGAVAAANASKSDPAALPAGSSALPVATPAPVEPWPLEGVAQLHHEIRTGTPPSAPAEPSPPREAPARPAVTKRAAILLGFVVLLAVALGGYALLRWRSPLAGPAKANATAPSAPARGGPATPIAAGIASADQLGEAQRAAERAGTMVDILAAADLRRYALAGVTTTTPNQPYGQVLWSRSRGLAASASRLPVPPGDKVYRLWIVPDGPPVAAGVLVPDAAGRATLLVAGPLTLPVPVTIRVTLEDKDETTTPRGPIWLARVPGA